MVLSLSGLPVCSRSALTSCDVAADAEEFFEAGGDAVLENGAPVFDAPHHVVVTGKDHVAVVAEFGYR